MLFKAGNYDLDLIDEPTYTPSSADHVRSSAREYDFTDAAYRPSSRHGLVRREDGVVRQSCILLAGGGAGGMHEHSIAIVDKTCFLAVGDTLCWLMLPSFELRWHRQVDHATRFGVYFSANHYCLISHGELEIARVSLSGEVVWSCGGADIFSEGIKVFPDYVEAIDFDQNIYKIDITNGKSLK
jgi:hypothetical protein